MHSRIWTAAVLLLAAPLVAIAGVTHEAVHGKLAPVVSGAAEKGRFRLTVADRGNGSHFERIEAEAKHLDATVEYHLYLVTSDASASADFGTLRVGPHGFGRFRFSTNKASLPSGVTTIADYGGGTVEVRDGTTAVISGAIPAFIGLGDTSGPGAGAFGHDSQHLRSTDVSFAGRGEITARRQNVHSGVREEMSVVCRRMTSAATYTVVAIAADTTETTLGTFTTSSPLGIGGFRLATRKGDTIPGGSVLDLAGQTVEVRDSGGAAVLTGTYPTLP